MNRPCFQFGLTSAAAMLGLLAVAGSAWAIQVELDISPRVLRLGESTTCRIIVRDAQGAQPPRLPPLAGFDVVPAGTEQRFELANGRPSGYTAYLYQLTPHEAGDFQIGPFRYDAGGDSITIGPVALQVLPPSGPSGESRARTLDELIFATLSASRTNVYANEIFDLVLQLYTQPGLNLDRNVSLLDFDTSGLSLEQFEELASAREAINGQIYDVRRYRARTIALTSGRFVLEPKLRVQVIVPRERQRVRDPFFGDAFFDSFFNRVETRPYTLAARPLALNVLDLPAADRPSDFSGAVGRYSFEVQAAPLELRIGEPITLRYRIQGRGNMDTVTLPPMNWPDGFRTFDAKLVEQNNQEGFKLFEQVVIPRSLNATNLPSIRFTFFDPEKGQYESISRGPFAIALKPGEQPSLVVQGPSEKTTSGAVPLGEDLVYLKPAPPSWSPSAAEREAHPLLHLAPGLALIGSWLFARRRERRMHDPAVALRAQAPRRARAGLHQASALLREDKIADAVRVLSETLADFFGRMMELPPGHVSGEEVCRRLRERGLAQSHLDALQETFKICEQVRFAGQAMTSSEWFRETLRQAIERLGPLLQAVRRLPK